MSKAHDPHWRYVALHIDGAPGASRGAVGKALGKAAHQAGWPADEAPQLTRFVHPHAIVKVPHVRLADARTLLPTINRLADGAAPAAVTIRTLRSSGTIKTLTDRLGVLRERKDYSKGSGGKRAPVPTTPSGRKAPGRGAAHPRRTVAGPMGGPAPPPGRSSSSGRGPTPAPGRGPAPAPGGGARQRRDAP